MRKSIVKSRINSVNHSARARATPVLGGPCRRLSRDFGPFTLQKWLKKALGPVTWGTHTGPRGLGRGLPLVIRGSGRDPLMNGKGQGGQPIGYKGKGP